MDVMYQQRMAAVLAIRRKKRPYSFN